MRVYRDPLSPREEHTHTCAQRARARARTLWHSGADFSASRIPERRGDRLEPVPSTPQTQRHHSDDTGSTETRLLPHAVQSAKASASSLESSLGSAATWSMRSVRTPCFSHCARLVGPVVIPPPRTQSTLYKNETTRYGLRHRRSWESSKDHDQELHARRFSSLLITPLAATVPRAP